MKKLVCILIGILLSVPNMIRAQSSNGNAVENGTEILTYPTIRRTIGLGDVQVIKSGEIIYILIHNLFGRVTIEYTSNRGHKEYLEIHLSGKEISIPLSKNVLLDGTSIQVTVRK